MSSLSDAYPLWDEMLESIAAVRDEDLSCRGRCGRDYQQQVLDRASQELPEALEVGARSREPSRNTTMMRVVRGQEGLLLKIDDSRPSDRIAEEFAALENLYQLACASGQFRVPYPVLALADRAAYAMEEVAGHSLATEIRRAADPPVEAARACGRALAAIHGHWSEKTVSPAQTQAMGRGPSQLGAFRHPPLGEAISSLQGRPLRASRLYLDPDPVNFLMGGDVPVLIDPPERRIVGLVHYDVAVFTVGVDRACVRRPPWRHRPGWSTSVSNAFLSGYLAEADMVWGVHDEVALRLCELLRLELLRTWAARPLRSHQKGKRLLKGSLGYTLFTGMSLARRRTLVDLLS